MVSKWCLTIHTMFVNTHSLYILNKTFIFSGHPGLIFRGLCTEFQGDYQDHNKSIQLVTPCWMDFEVCLGSLSILRSLPLLNFLIVSIICLNIIVSNLVSTCEILPVSLAATQPPKCDESTPCHHICAVLLNNWTMQDNSRVCQIYLEVFCIKTGVLLF